MATILIIEDDLTFSRILEGFLNKQGFKVHIAHKGAAGLQLFTTTAFDLVLLDYRLPDMTGIEVLVDIKKSSPSTEVIIMTSFSDIRTAVKAMQVGAFEYITKPVNPDELLMIVKQALRGDRPSLDSVDSKDIGKSRFVVGSSPLATKLYEHVRLVAPTDMSVIIEGESGTGKENVAQTIHRLSMRAKARFVAVDCGALSMELAGSELFGHIRGAFTGAVQDKVGQFEEAHKGTLFLDEVGNLSLEIQMKLLRAIQERVIQPLGSNKEIKVDVRIITATNDDLFKSVRKGNFREDLYHRLNEFKLKVPAVRERYDDLDEFLDFFRVSANEELSRHVSGFTKEVEEIFRSYDWPGNLREMKNVVRRAVLLTSEGLVHLQALPPEMLNVVRNIPLNAAASGPVYDLKALQESQEKEMIIKTLKEVRYNKSKAARILNIDRKTLYSKMEKYGIA
ncbi:MAG: sigma-54 dependent transcriptional regulator [Cyclobacteriaceae bacterium]|nr:sigma-54 dependent transcriptional regulator [Cyclobacteriaceae bacterium]MDH5249315.1 sigma-54 dependent transcriptional regulator [Cyclobacteriaceae bacterium]